MKEGKKNEFKCLQERKDSILKYSNKLKVVRELISFEL